MQENLNILLLGAGDRERSLALKLLQSPRCNTLFTEVGNIPGTTHCTLNHSDFESIIHFCNDYHIDILVPGPEAPIVNGIRDAFDEAGSSTRVISPSREAALLEGSKEFAKEFMADEGIPTPRFMPVDTDTLEEGLSFLDSLPGPYVIKADGLANGEGVLICDNLPEAKDALEDMIRGKFGEASQKVLVEEFVTGQECSIIIATDGEDYILLPPARDYKRRLDNDMGPNTRGMGAYSPVAFADDVFMQKVEKRIINPTLRALAEREIPYSGFLYFGVMSIEGEPVLIEYNVRLGDPETQAIMPRIKSDFVDILEGIADRTIGLKRLEVTPEAAASVVVMRNNHRALTLTASGDTPAEAARKIYASLAERDSLLPNLSADDVIEYRSDIAAL